MKEFKVFPMPLKVRYKGVFDFGELYNTVYNFLKERGFRYHEERFKTKAQTALGNEIKFKLWAEKEVSEYYQYKVKMYFHLWESKEIPVIIDGKQVMRMKGRMNIDINGSVFTDWQKHFKSDENFFHKIIENFLNKTVLKYNIDMQNIDPFDKDLHLLESKIKKVLNMEADETGVGHYL